LLEGEEGSGVRYDYLMSFVCELSALVNVDKVGDDDDARLCSPDGIESKANRDDRNINSSE
jgi:hypothetical protein